MQHTTRDYLEMHEMMEQIYAKSNFPRFEEFAKNPDKWRKNPEDLFETISSMNLWFKSRVKTVTYFWHGIHKCTSLEQLQRMAKEEGYTGLDLEMRPATELTFGNSNLHDNKVDLRVNIYTKMEVRLMGGVVTND